ncbi:hypothetical protein VNI00_006470 [Paramarasmius palmivorus]|uniref:Uncharacterized protein n=1 Tax=Paramarasmius palmivorus TaxID=297713 RepID=A0AAW0D5E2_9AGAR
MAPLYLESTSTSFNPYQTSTPASKFQTKGPPLQSDLSFLNSRSLQYRFDLMSKTPRRNLAREAREAVDTFSGVLRGEERGNAKKRLYVDTSLEELPNDFPAVDGAERSEEEGQANTDHWGAVSREEGQVEVQREVQKSERPSKRSRKHNPEKLKRVQRGSKMYQYIPPSDAQSLPPSSQTRLSRRRTSIQSQSPPSTTFFQGWSTEEYARHSSSSPHPAHTVMHPDVSTPYHSFSTPTSSTFSHRTDSFPASHSWTLSPTHPGAQAFGGASRPNCYRDNQPLPGHHGLGSSAQHRQAPTSSYEISSPNTPSTPQFHQPHMGGYPPPLPAFAPSPMHYPSLSADSPQCWVEGTVPWSTFDQLGSPDAGQDDVGAESDMEKLNEAANEGGWARRSHR